MKNATLLFLIALVSFNSCKKKPKEFNEHINITMQEADLHDTTKKRLTFKCKTEKIYPCSSCMLVNTITIDGYNIVINFTDVAIPKYCPSPPAPANYPVELGALENGNYTVVINNGSKQNSGTLIITDESYTLTLQTANNISVTESVLRKKPGNTIWGSVTYADATIMPRIDSFIDSLEIIGAQPFTGADGNYGDFRISGGNIVLATDAAWLKFGLDKSKNFIYEFTGKEKSIDSLVRNFGMRPGPVFPYKANYKVVVKSGRIYEYPGLPVEI
jgi:hypothetical protein